VGGLRKWQLLSLAIVATLVVVPAVLVGTDGGDDNGRPVATATTKRERTTRTTEASPTTETTAAVGTTTVPEATIPTTPVIAPSTTRPSGLTGTVTFDPPRPKAGEPVQITVRLQSVEPSDLCLYGVRFDFGDGTSRAIFNWSGEGPVPGGDAPGEFDDEQGAGAAAISRKVPRLYT
jgi:hypothetical protein